MAVSQMKRSIKESDICNIFAMTQLKPRDMDSERSSHIAISVYVSEVQSGHGPRIKFDGGTQETRTSRNAPSYSFGVDGPIDVKLLPWHNKKNCPNAYNKDVLNQIRLFIDNLLPILLLLWFERLDQSECENYIRGFNSFSDVVENVVENMRGIFSYASIDRISNSQDFDELHEAAKSIGLYSFS